jgi:anti-sigma factor RsiW
MKLKCDEVEQWLSAALDGELGTKEEAQLDQHLADCERCQARRKAYALQTQLMQTAAVTGKPAAPEMWEAVRAEVAKAAAVSDTRKPIPFPRMLSAVAALLMIGLGLYFFNRSGMNQDDPVIDLAEYSVESSIEDATIMTWVEEESGMVVFWVDEPSEEEIDDAIL